MTKSEGPHESDDFQSADLQEDGSTTYLVVICLVATLGGLLFGYDTAQSIFLSNILASAPPRKAGPLRARWPAVPWAPCWPV